VSSWVVYFEAKGFVFGFVVVRVIRAGLSRVGANRVRGGAVQHQQRPSRLPRAPSRRHEVLLNLFQTEHFLQAHLR
jgi:hypothetical protein